MTPVLPPAKAARSVGSSGSREGTALRHAGDDAMTLENNPIRSIQDQVGAQIVLYYTCA